MLYFKDIKAYAIKRAVDFSDGDMIENFDTDGLIAETREQFMADEYESREDRDYDRRLIADYVRQAVEELFEELESLV